MERSAVDPPRMDDDAPRLPQPFASANHADNVGHLIASVKEQIGNPPALIAMCGRLFQNIADSPATRLYPTVVPRHRPCGASGGQAASGHVG
jgi:hypothetical protein